MLFECTQKTSGYSHHLKLLGPCTYYDDKVWYTKYSSA